MVSLIFKSCNNDQHSMGKQGFWPPPVDLIPLKILLQNMDSLIRFLSILKLGMFFCGFLQTLVKSCNCLALISDEFLDWLIQGSVIPESSSVVILFGQKESQYRRSRQSRHLGRSELLWLKPNGKNSKAWSGEFMIPSQAETGLCCFITLYVDRYC